MRKLTSFLALAISTLMLSAQTGAAEYYVWVDENGVTNYSERNPRDKDARHVTPRDRLGTGAQRVFPDDETMDEEENEYSGKRPQATIAAQRAAEAAERSSENAPVDPAVAAAQDGNIDPDAIASDEREQLQEQIATAKRENCDIGKRNLAQLQAYSRIRVTGDDGQERVLSAAEREEQIEQARQIIRENCTG